VFVTTGSLDRFHCDVSIRGTCKTKQNKARRRERKSRKKRGGKKVGEEKLEAKEIAKNEKRKWREGEI